MDRDQRSEYLRQRAAFRMSGCAPRAVLPRSHKQTVHGTLPLSLLARAPPRSALPWIGKYWARHFPRQRL